MCTLVRTLLYGAILDFRHTPDSWCSCEDNLNLELSRRVPVTVGLTINRHIVLSPLFQTPLLLECMIVVNLYDSERR